MDIEVSKLKIMKADHNSKQFRLEDSLLKYFPEKIEEHLSLIHIWMEVCPLSREIMLQSLSVPITGAAFAFSIAPYPHFPWASLTVCFPACLLYTSRCV